MAPFLRQICLGSHICMLSDLLVGCTRLSTSSRVAVVHIGRRYLIMQQLPRELPDRQ